MDACKLALKLMANKCAVHCRLRVLWNNAVNTHLFATRFSAKSPVCLLGVHAAVSMDDWLLPNTRDVPLIREPDEVRYEVHLSL